MRDNHSFRVAPYPFDTVSPGTPLALYIEAYGLAFDTDDRTRYTRRVHRRTPSQTRRKA